MDNQLSYYRDLLKKYLAGDISDLEANELFDFIRNEPQRAIPLLRESEGEQYSRLIKSQPGLDQGVSDRMRDRLLQAINTVPFETPDEAPETALYSIKPQRKQLGWAAVAAILILALGAGYLYLANKNEKPDTIAKTSPVPADVPAPKTNRATVTLAGGKTIFLDSAANGQLAVQGGSILKKMGDGQIAYATVKDQGAAPEMEYNTLVNPRGSKVISLTLSDGTRVWLNAESSLHYPITFNGSSREVEITGEAYFEVKHNAARPFRVKARDQLIEDIGTGFNVDAYPDEAEVKTTLLEGSVKVSLPSGNPNQTGEKILKPGQQADVAGGNIKVLNDVDLTRVIAWQQGRFEFNQTGLPVILRQISRWYDVDIKTEGPTTTETFGGAFSRNLPLSDILKLLESTGLQFRLEGKTLFVNNKPK